MKNFTEKAIVTIMVSVLPVLCEYIVPEIILYYGQKDLAIMVEMLWRWVITPVYLVSVNKILFKNLIPYAIIFLFNNLYVLSVNSWEGIRSIIDYVITHSWNEAFFPFVFILTILNIILAVGYLICKYKVKE